MNGADGHPAGWPSVLSNKPLPFRTFAAWIPVPKPSSAC